MAVTQETETETEHQGAGKTRNRTVKRKDTKWKDKVEKRKVT